jgi:FMN phosphatase YigB (HAD superfamily)
VDDVLNDLTLAWFTGDWKPAHPACTLSYSDITENPPDRVLGITRKEYLNSLDAFRVSDRADAMPPNAAVLEWLRDHGARYRHIALTARPLASAPNAAAWLFRHFGIYLRSFGLVPSRLETDMPAYDRDKGEFLEWFAKAGVLVDDSEENIRAAERAGFRCVLYPQPWNRAGCSVAETLRRLAQLAEAN